MVHLLGIAVRRNIGAHWLAPVIAIPSTGGRLLYRVPLAMHTGDDGAYYAHFTAPASGLASIYVNYAILPGSAETWPYRDNLGSGTVQVFSEN